MTTRETIAMFLALMTIGVLCELSGKPTQCAVSQQREVPSAAETDHASGAVSVSDCTLITQSQSPSLASHRDDVQPARAEGRGTASRLRFRR